MLIDIHTHLQFQAFKDDRDEVIRRTLEGGVSCINVGTQLDTSRAAVKLAEAHDGFWAAVGLHPIHTSDAFVDPDELDGAKGFSGRAEVFDEAAYETLARHPKTVAIGECGLDYFRPEGLDKEKQKAAFRAQVRLAKKLGKPLMLHCRPSPGENGARYSDDAYDDMIAVLKEEGAETVGGNVHFFVGSERVAGIFLDLGFTFSFSGVLTITSAYDDIVQKLPLDSILIETDAPYAAPKPWRGKRNEPLYVKEVAKRLAELRGFPVEEIERITTENAKRVFKLEG